ncbi:MAG: MopE-related protein, partial [Deltaproteobacteria bacterium]
AGSSQTVWVELRNVGTNPWDATTRLGTQTPRDRSDLFAGPDWLNTARPATIPTGTNVAPGESFRFQFTFSIPTGTAPGYYAENFGMLGEGVAWFTSTNRDPSVFVTVLVQVIPATASIPDGGLTGTNVNPGETEICDGLDNNCNGSVDEGDPGGGGMCGSGLLGVCARGANHCVAGNIMCEPTVLPGAQLEVCNAFDDDCNGTIDDVTPTPCTTNHPTTYPAGTPCDSGHAACVAGADVCDRNVSPMGETCNNIDDDCDGLIDNGIAANSCTARSSATPTCTAGTCGFACNPGFGDCNLNPADGCEVNLSSNTANCGACGTRCATGGSCSGGSCTCSGTAGTSCGGVCRDTANDFNNCGSCGRVCPAGASCSGSICHCPGTTGAACGTTCRDLANDFNNCGVCGRVCGAGGSCSGGICRCPGTTGTNCSGTCRDLANDFNNCGACGTICPVGASCSTSCVCPGTRGTNCSGSCRDLATDASNCGGCGTVCPAPASGSTSCSGSVCRPACPSGRTLCGTTCVLSSYGTSECFNGSRIPCTRTLAACPGTYGGCPASGLLANYSGSDFEMLNGTGNDGSNNARICGITPCLGCGTYTMMARGFGTVFSAGRYRLHASTRLDSASIIVAAARGADGSGEIARLNAPSAGNWQVWDFDFDVTGSCQPVYIIVYIRANSNAFACNLWGGGFLSQIAGFY